MRLVPPLALLVVLLLAYPARAEKKEMDMSSEGQVSQYGGIAAYLALSAGALVAILVGYHMLKGMKAEAARGKKSIAFTDKVLDAENKKRKVEVVLFLGEKVPDWKIDNRLKATTAVLKFLSDTDELFAKKFLTKVASQAITIVRTAIETRTTKKIAFILLPDCLEKVKSEISGLGQKKKLRVFGQFEVDRVDIVHVEVPVGKQNHTFTALITATSKDYIKDEKTGEVLKGDKKFYTYQEFWRFRRSKSKWLVERIRPADDMDRVLNEKNVLAQTDLTEFANDAEPEYLREFVGK